MTESQLLCSHVVTVIEVPHSLVGTLNRKGSLSEPFCFAFIVLSLPSDKYLSRSDRCRLSQQFKLTFEKRGYVFDVVITIIKGEKYEIV